MKTAQLVPLYIACLLGILPITASAQPYSVSPDGTEVTDKKTGLIWQRCAEGMKWNKKTCTGVASTFTHQAAVQLGITRAAATGKNWRLPNIDELSSIVDINRANPAINRNAFPATPAKSFWSSSPPVGEGIFGWYIDFSDGYTHNEYNQGKTFLVRLVRSGQ